MKTSKRKPTVSILTGAVLCFILSFLLITGSVPVCASAADTAGYYPTQTIDFQASGRVWIAGDSIAADHGYEDENTYARFVHGWGELLANYLTEDAYVFNGGISGQSAKYFIEEDNYQTIMEGIGEGDIFLISFGHNDYKSDGVSHSTLGSDVEGSYKWYLKTYYIDPALAVGAMPVLCTSVVLCSFSGDFISQNQTQMQFVKAMKELYEEYQAQGIEIGLIDTNSLTRELYNADPDGATDYFALKYDSSEKTSTSLDRVHSSYAGADAIAEMIAENLCLMFPDFNRYNAASITDGGSGTEDDPYLISTWLQFYQILQDTSLNNPDTYFALTTDLLPRLQHQEAETVFYANLDGCGHTIKNPVGTAMRSFLDVNYGTISNLNLEYNLSFSPACPQAAFVAENYGTITNCTASGSICFDYYPDTIETFLSCGIFAGINYAGGSIVNCTNTTDFELGTHICYSCLAGIAGVNAGLISGCTNSGSIVISAYEYDASNPYDHDEVVCVAAGIAAITTDSAEMEDAEGTTTPRIKCTLDGTISILLTDQTVAVTAADLEQMLADAALGDVDRDGAVTIDDAQLVLQYALRLAVPADEDTQTRADVDSDGSITLTDARKLLRAALQIEAL